MPRTRLWMLFLALVALSVFLTPASRDLFVGDETKYAQVVREMRGGAVFLPTLEGTPFTHKPPLHFWMIDALTYLFGVYSTWSFVLPSIAAYLGLLWVMWRMEGPLAAFVCATSLMMWGSAQTARMDVTFTLTIAAAFWLLQRGWSSGDLRTRTLAIRAAGVVLGAGTLVKGPMTLVMALFLFLFEWLRRKERPPGPYVTALLAATAIPLLWFIPAMAMGGGRYAHEVLIKQTAGRAVGAWVHRSPPWFYVAHAPLTLFPWFILLLLALFAASGRRDTRSGFYGSWILAVVVPYSLMSSKLDVYMMAMIPPTALLVARLLAVRDRWAGRARAANLAMLLLLGMAGLAAPFLPVKDGQRAALLSVLAILAVASFAALVASLIGRTPLISTLALGLVPIVVLSFAATRWMPVINELASDRPLVRTLMAQSVAADEIALYSAPHLWTRDMPAQLERVRYVSPQSLQSAPATLIVTSRSHAREIAGVLQAYRKVAQCEMIGKPFDVYRR